MRLQGGLETRTWERSYREAGNEAIGVGYLLILP